VLTLPNQNISEALISLDDDIVTSKTIADDYCVDVETVYRWIRQGIIPVFRINTRCLRFSRREVGQAIARYRVKELEVEP
jgi:predicted site-specific integrase-resolvase